MSELPPTPPDAAPAPGPAAPRARVHPLVAFAVHRRVTMVMALVGVLVLGVLSLQRLPLEFLPTISSSNISVRASYASSSPAEISREILRPLEDSFGTLNNLDRMSSSASAEGATVNLTFVDGIDMDLAAVEVRDRLDRARPFLPPDLDRLTVRRFQSTDLPVLSLFLGASWPQDRLYDFAERIFQRRLERLEGVAQVDLRGLRQREVQVRLDRDRLEAHGIEVRSLVSRLRNNHLNLSAGRIEDGSRKLLVRVLGELSTLEEIRQLPLGDGSLSLGDVAEVVYAYPEQENFNFLNGSESLTARVYKTSDANLLAVSDRVKAEIAAIQAEARYGQVQTNVYHDASLDVRQGLSSLSNAGLVGGALAVLAVFCFLRRWRTTLLIAIAMPVSVVFAFVLMYLLRQAGWSDLTLNVVSLMGLVLAMGMLVDNSIVVIEAIYRRLQELGEDARTAALRGASEVALPITAATATTLCVFIPVIFLSGGSGYLVRQYIEIGTSVCIVMVASLVVALTVVPLAASVLLAREGARPSRVFARLAGVYGRGLNLTLRSWPGRLLTVALAAGLLYGSYRLLETIERSAGSRTLSRQLTVFVDTPRAYSLEQTATLFEELGEIFEANRDKLDIAHVTARYSTGSGRSRGRGGGSEKRFDLYLKDESESRITTVEAQDRVRALLPEIPGVELKLGQSQHRWGGGGLEVQLSGDDPTVLELLGREMAAQLEVVPGITDVDLSLESGDDEVHVEVRPDRALAAGLTSQTIAQTVQSALSSRAVSYLKTPDRDVDLVMQFQAADRENLGQLRNLPLGRGAGGTAAAVPLDTVANLKIRPGPRSIERENRRSKVTLTANSPSPVAQFAARGRAQQLLATLSLPPGYEWSFGRWTRIQQQDAATGWFAIGFSVILVYMLMAALFESFRNPFAILLSIPFAFVGVAVAMKLAGIPWDDFTRLGLLILLGVVVNNAIVLVDHVNRLRSAGAGPIASILQGSKDRLRAILMTAVTTILGLLPMVSPILFPWWFGPLEGRAATWAPMGLVILGGLAASTFLTLVLLPTAYLLIDLFAGGLRRVWRAV